MTLNEWLRATTFQGKPLIEMDLEELREAFRESVESYEARLSGERAAARFMEELAASR